MNFYSRETDEFIENCLKEDIGPGDFSTLASVPADHRGHAHILFKEKGILAGMELAVAILQKLDTSVETEILIADGANIEPGNIGLQVYGNTRALLGAERLLLNCMQRLSGIATLTRKVVDEVAGTGVKILDTRKTTPGMRFLEKWAVTMGGGYNHRRGLYDMIMLKDNHVDHAGSITQALLSTRKYMEEHHLNLKIEIETRNLAEVEEVLALGIADRIMFDNFSPALIREAVQMVNGKMETEASGGITIQNIRPYAETGVDFISVGALTHSAPGLDISFKQYRNDSK